MIRNVKLGSIAIEAKESVSSIPPGTPIVGLEHLDPGELTLSRWDVTDKTTFTKTFKKGDVLFGRRRAYLKKAAVAPFDGVCSGDITVIRAMPNKIRPGLLAFLIQNDRFFAHAVKNSDGSLSPRAKWASLKEFAFALDDDLSVQDRILDLLESINNTKLKYKKVLAKCDELIKSRFVEMFSCHKRVYLGQYINQIRGVSYKPQDLGNNDSEHVILLRANNITSSGLLLDDLQFVCRDKVQDEQFLKCHDSLVCASSGSIEVLGKHVYIDRDLDFVFGAFCKVLRPKRSAFSRFIDGFFRTDDYRSQIKELGQGTNINNLSNSSFDSIRLPLVSEEEALTFGKYICQIDKLKFVSRINSKFRRNGTLYRIRRCL